MISEIIIVIPSIFKFWRDVYLLDPTVFWSESYCNLSWILNLYLKPSLRQMPTFYKAVMLLHKTSISRDFWSCTILMILEHASCDIRHRHSGNLKRLPLALFVHQLFWTHSLSRFGWMVVFDIFGKISYLI